MILPHLVLRPHIWIVQCSARSPTSALLIPQWKQIPRIYGPHFFLSLDFRKLDVVSPLMTDPPNTYSTTLTDTHLLSDIGDNLLSILLNVNCQIICPALQGHILSTSLTQFYWERAIPDWYNKVLDYTRKLGKNYVFQ